MTKCIHCLKPINLDEYFANDFVHTDCLDKLEVYPFATTPTATTSAVQGATVNEETE